MYLFLGAIVTPNTFWYIVIAFVINFFPPLLGPNPPPPLIAHFSLTSASAPAVRSTLESLAGRPAHIQPDISHPWPLAVTILIAPPHWLLSLGRLAGQLL